MVSRLSLFLIILTFLTGCALPQISLKKETQQDIQSAEIILFIPQNNLDVSIHPTEGGGGGLLGVLIAAGIDSARRSYAEKKAAPIIEQLQHYDFRAEMLKALSAEIEKINNIKFKISINLETVYSESQKTISFDKSDRNAVIFTTVAYRLQSGNLIVTSDSEMYPKSTSLYKFRSKPNDTNPIDAGNCIYRKTFEFTKQATTAENIKNSLAEGAASIAKQLVQDLNHPL